MSGPAASPPGVSSPRAGLVLTSGGARGAYQAGVLKAIGEMAPKGSNPFPILTGVSAGSLNAGFLAARTGSFAEATEGLASLWSSLTPNKVFCTDTFTLSRIGMNWITDLSFGGMIGAGRGQSLLDTRPLRELLNEVLDLAALGANYASGAVRGFAVTATNYTSGTAMTFFDGAADIEPWTRSTRMGVRAPVTVEHLMASSSIPVFFPAVALEGSFYGDGSIRLTTPLSPAIHLGADRVLAIGIRRRRDEVTTAALNKPSECQYPSVADVGGVLLNAMFLDALEADIERMMRINQTLSLIPEEKRRAHPSQLREVPVMAIRPSQDLGKFVSRTINAFPGTVRYLLKGLGASQDRGSDLLSYLAFDADYTKPLVELGYQDGMSARRELTDFLGLA